MLRVYRCFAQFIAEHFSGSLARSITGQDEDTKTFLYAPNHPHNPPIQEGEWLGVLMSTI